MKKLSISDLVSGSIFVYEEGNSSSLKPYWSVTIVFDKVTIQQNCSCILNLIVRSYFILVPNSCNRKPLGLIFVWTWLSVSSK